VAAATAFCTPDGFLNATAATTTTHKRLFQKPILQAHGNIVDSNNTRSHAAQLVVKGSGTVHQAFYFVFLGHKTTRRQYFQSIHTVVDALDGSTHASYIFFNARLKSFHRSLDRLDAFAPVFLQTRLTLRL
jgi:hypothetical protein